MTTGSVVSSSKRARASKHSVRVLPSLREWETRTFDQIKLTSVDRELCARFTEGKKGRLQIDELREGVRVSSRSWVGVVRLDTIEIRIVPKLAGDQLGLVRLLEFTSGIEGLRRLDAEAALTVAGDHLFDLVALLFAEATEVVIRRGLILGYVEHEEALPVVRGRILADRQVLQRFGCLDRIICRFDESEYDIDENRLLVAALAAASRFVQSNSVHRRLSRLRSILEPICDPSELDLRSTWRELSYNRLNAHYESAHALGWLLLDGLGIEDLLTGGRTQSFSFLLNMNVLFEGFVDALIRRVLDAQGFRVRSQAIYSSLIWNASTGAPHTRVVPDLVIETRGPSQRRLPIDAKYKLYDEKRLSPDDIYQTFLYAYSLGSRAGTKVPSSLLIYPATSTRGRKHHLQVRSLYSDRGAEIIGAGVPIPAALEELQHGVMGPACGAVKGLVEDLLRE